MDEKIINTITSYDFHSDESFKMLHLYAEMEDVKSKYGFDIDKDCYREDVASLLDKLIKPKHIEYLVTVARRAKSSRMCEKCKNVEKSEYNTSKYCGICGGKMGEEVIDISLHLNIAIIYKSEILTDEKMATLKSFLMKENTRNLNRYFFEVRDYNDVVYVELHETDSFETIKEVRKFFLDLGVKGTKIGKIESGMHFHDNITNCTNCGETIPLLGMESHRYCHKCGAYNEYVELKSHICEIIINRNEKQ